MTAIAWAIALAALIYKGTGQDYSVVVYMLMICTIREWFR